MATSGSIDFTVTRDDVITEALEQIGVLGEGESPNASQLTSSARTLNMMVKAWQADGLNLFAIQRLYLFLQKLQKEYSIDSSTSDHVTASFVETTTSTTSLSGGSTITVTSATGISNGDNIGIEQGTDMQWTTVNGAPAGDVITLTDTLDADVATAAIVYAYTTKANRPMKIAEAFLHIQSSGTDIPTGKISRRRYNRLSVKDTDGFVNQFYYDPQVSNPNLFVWPRANDESDYLVLFAQRTLEDFDTASDNPDFPQEWYLPLALGLAVLIAPKYGLPRTEYIEIATQAETWYERAREFDEELYTSVYFAYDQRGEEL